MKVLNDLYFRLAERKAIFTLFMIGILLIGTLQLRNYYAVPKYKPISEDDKNRIVSLESSDSSTIRPEWRTKYSANQRSRSNGYGKQGRKRQSKKEFEKFQFDPNSISKDSLELLGISGKTASILDNYRKKGGRFRKPEDLKKVYGMDKHFDEIKNLISIKQPSADEGGPAVTKDSLGNTVLDSTWQTKKYTPQVDSSYLLNSAEESEKASEISVTSIRIYELNEVDTYEIQLVRGIGEKLSKRILKYRGRLGGFYDVEQLYEVWGMEGPRTAELVHSFTVDTTLITKLKVNYASVDELREHAYLQWKKGTIVDRYRKNHYPIRNMEEFKKIKIFSDEELEKLRPYLDFEYEDKSKGKE